MFGWFRRFRELPPRDYVAEQRAQDAAYRRQTLEYLQQYDTARDRNQRDQIANLKVAVGELVAQMAAAGLTPRVSRVALSMRIERPYDTIHDISTDDIVLIAREPNPQTVG